MMVAHFGRLVQSELRLRMRRWSTLLAVLSASVLGWASVNSPENGTMITVAEAKVHATTSALALGSAALIGPLLLLFGFYLLRGRVGEDLRSGLGVVIAATQTHNTTLLCSRWLAGVIYLLALVAAYGVSILSFQMLHGDGAIELGVYLQTYALILGPAVWFAASCAMLADAIPKLMGKAGDVAYFALFIAQLALMSQLSSVDWAYLPDSGVFDFSGIVVGMHALTSHLGSTEVSLGFSTYDSALPAITLPQNLWSATAIQMRLASFVLALLPLLASFGLFHRFSPDRVNASHARQRRSPLALVNAWMQPMTRWVQPLFHLAIWMPGRLGQLLADVALTLVATPTAVLVILLGTLASLFSEADNLKVLLIPLVAFWGVLVSDISTRDFTAHTESMTGATPGGARQRYLRRVGASFLLGLMFMGVIALRWSTNNPFLALALITGLLSLSAVATWLGGLSRTSRTFLITFLLLWWGALNARDVAWLDVVGFNGAATASSVLGYLLVALITFTAGYRQSGR